MAENSKIEWTDHTFNPWRGCTKVSDGCTNCYADTLSKRNPRTLGVWGKHGTRVVASESMWKQPLKWDHAAKYAKPRHRVFCSSLADVFEGYSTMPDASRPLVHKARMRLFDLIDATPNLDWLLLTKRPQNVTPILNDISNGNGDAWSLLNMPNVWLGTSVEDQKTADERIPHLLNTPAAVRFLSMEPLLGPVDDIHDYLGDRYWWCVSCDREESSMEHNGECEKCGDTLKPIGGIDWVIVGGESGGNARPMHPDWVRSIRDQCNAADVPFFFKQWGEWWPIGQMPDGVSDNFYGNQYPKPRRPEYDDRPAPRAVDSIVLQLDGSVEFAFPKGAMTCFKVGKKKAGRLLDGREWNEFPKN